MLALETETRSLPLRPYQEQALDAVAAARARGVQRQLVVLPTGTGKTVVLATLTTRRNGRALILAHRDELISQTVSKLAMVTNSLDVGVVKAAQDDYSARVVVASVQTLASEKRLARIGGFGTVIVDEAHHAVASTYLDILRGLGCMDESGPLTVGFTATAARSDKVGLGHVWQEVVYQRGILQMIAEGYLCDVRALEVTSEFDIDRAEVKAGDYTDASLGAELERSGTIDAAALAYAQHARDRLGVAFTPTIATAHDLAAALSARGIRAEAVDGTMPLEQRREVLRRLHKGEIQVVPNAQVLTEGWDEPAVSCVLMLRPTKSAPAFTQMVGRVLRPYPGKDDALVLDVAGAAAQAGLCTVADLAGLPPGAAKPGKSLMEAAEEHEASEQHRAVIAAQKARQVELLRRSDLRWLRSGDAWVLPAGPDQVMILVPSGDEAWDVWRSAKGERPVLESGRSMSLEWAQGVGEEVARQQGGILSSAKAPWRSRPPSGAQVATLERLGIAQPDGLTRGGAADLLTVHFAGRDVRRIAKAGGA